MPSYWSLDACCRPNVGTQFAGPSLSAMVVTLTLTAQVCGLRADPLKPINVDGRAVAMRGPANVPE
jgi:hypothetical protein